MTKAVQRRRGTNAEHSSFTGLEGEISIDTTLDTLVLHDGSTAGGFPMAAPHLDNAFAASQSFGTLDIFSGSITDSSGAISFGNENLTTTGNVGIGTNSPSARLHVQGPVDTAAISTSSTPAARINNGGAISLWAGSNNYNYGYIQSIQDDGSNNLKPLVLQPLGGNVGIGTASPEGTLQVENASNNALILNAPANRYNSVGFQTAGTDKWWLGRADSDLIASDAFFIGKDNGNATDAGGFSAKLVIDDSGNVGIGTTSPAALLTVQSASPVIQLTATTTTATTLGAKNNRLLLTSNSTTLGGGGEIVFNTSDSNTGRWGAISGHIKENASGAASGAIVFATKATTADTALTERMRIDNSGKVGIGTSSPDGKLHVHTATAGAVTANVGADELVVENSAAGGISILTPDASKSTLALGSPTANMGLLLDWTYSTGVATLTPLKVGAALNFGADNGVLNLTLSGASGSELATFAGDVTLAGGKLGSTAAAYGAASVNGTWSMGGDAAGGLNFNALGSALAYEFRSNGTSIFYISNAGNATFTGSLSKGSGSFKIDHPLKPNTHQLVHSFVEAPQADLYYRGKVSLVDGVATVNIDEAAGMTEGTFVALCRDVQCFTSNEESWHNVRGSVLGNILTIECQDLTCADLISWLVVGERQDKHMYDTDWTDDEGRVIVEPEKTNPEAILIRKYGKDSAEYIEGIALLALEDEADYQATEEYTVEEVVVEVIDGKAVHTTKTVTKEQPLFDELPCVDANGDDICDEHGEVMGHQVPRMVLGQKVSDADKARLAELLGSL